MSKKLYFNAVQQRIFLIGANTTVVVAGRRTGKTHGIAPPFVWRNIQRMPGSTNGIVVPTFKHGLTNTLPGLLSALDTWGIKNGVHYVVGRKPPKSFARAIVEPSDYEHVISFYNGSRCVIISQDRPGSSNSLTLSSVLVDEAKFINFEKLKDETLPANGGNKSFFGKHSFNHSLMILSDMPQTKKGSWFLKYEEQMDRELIEVIEGIVWKIYELKQKAIRETNETARKKIEAEIRRYDRNLNRLRANAVYYKEYSSVENLQLLGEKYIRQMKRDLPALTFMTSIMSQKIGIVHDGFYSSMQEYHKYNASNFGRLDDLFNISFGKNKIELPVNLNAEVDADVDPDQSISIGMDYNANINWIVAGQPYRNKLKVINSFYVKYERKIPELIDDFCQYYKYHRRKRVIYYYDLTAVGNNYAVNNDDFYHVVVREFRQRGWEVTPVYLGTPMAHKDKYLFINEGFAGRNKLEPYFNEQNNQDLILAIQTAKVYRGQLGFRKDKSGEKLAEKEEDKLENRTDGTDAFDTLYIGCVKYPKSEVSNLIVTGVS